MSAVGVGNKYLAESIAASYEGNYPLHTSGVELVENIVEQKLGLYSEALAQ